MPVTISTDPDTATAAVECHGADRIWALRSRVEFSTSAIRSVAVAPDPFSRGWPFEDGRMGLRIPGTSVPGRYLAGTYRTRTEWRFAVLRRGAPALVIRLDGQHYSGIAVATEDPAADAARLAGLAGIEVSPAS